MTAKSTTYHSSTTGIPKPALDNILHYLMLQQIRTVKQTASHPLSKHPHFIFHYYKNFRLAHRLRSIGLSILNSRFSKFPVDHGSGR